MEDSTIPTRDDPGESRPLQPAHPIVADTLSSSEQAKFEAWLAAYRAEVPCDEEGPIPRNFPRSQFDEHGHLIPPSPEEMEARRDAYRRLKKYQSQLPKEAEPPGLDEAIMRGIDSHRPEGAKLFEGYY